MIKRLLLLLMIMCISIKVNAAEKILPVPLDSRPFCSKTVVDAARIASIEMPSPPHELLDYFTVPGEVDELRSWTLDHIAEVDAAILSIDQLTAGGLIASREKIITDAEIDRLIEFLIELRRRAPNKKLYAFSILPRHLPPSSIENYHQRKALIEYSRLLSRADADIEMLIELDAFITAENKRLYFDRFRQSEKLNRRLIALTELGVIDRLIIGSDDSERHSIQNILAARLSKELNTRVSITHGADELAMTLLARHVLGDRQFKIRVEYNDRTAAYRVMPFMSASVGEVVVEKINLLGAKIIDEGEDFTLFVSVDGARKKIFPPRGAALVDLAVHFDRDETLLPIMIAAEFPINSLLAYSSFNTTGNSIGCALAEAAITLSSLARSNSIDDAADVCRANINFLNARIIEDQLYLKEAIDSVNNALRKLGRDPAYLDFGLEYNTASFVLDTVMANKIERYRQSKSFRTPIRIKTPAGLLKIRAEDIRASMRFPWPRTFEIELQSNVRVSIEKSRDV